MRNVRIAVVVLVALAGATGCAYFNTLYNAEQKYKEAQAQKEAADPERERISKSEERLYTESFEKAAKVVKYYPDSKYVDDALLLMGKASFEKGDYSTALRKFDEILTFYPGSKLVPEALVMKGRTLAATRDYEAAVTALLAAEKMDRKELRDEVLYFLGVVREGQGETDIAQQRYAQVVERHEDSEWFSEAGLRAGDLAMERSDPGAAVAFYDKVRKHGRTPDERYRGGMRKGEAFLELGEYERARKTFEDVGKKTLDPQDRGHAMLMKAKTRLTAGEDDAAIDELLAVIRDFERREAAADAQLEIAQWHDRNGRLEEALEVYEKVKDQGTGHPAWQTASARRTEIQRVLDLRAAVEDEADPDRHQNRFLLAEQLLEKIGDVDAALREYASLAADADGTEWGARALFAEAWVLEHRVGDSAAADSLLFHLANHYSGTDVDGFARRKLGYPVWKVEIVEPPPVKFIRPEGGDDEPDVVLDRVEPTPVDQPFPPGMTEAKVWVRVEVAEDGTAAGARVAKSAGTGLVKYDDAALEAARASRYLSPSAGGPLYQVMEYTFPPESAAGADDEPTAAERDARLDARDAAAAARAAQADSAAAGGAQADSAAAPPSTPVETPRGPVLRDREVPVAARIEIGAVRRSEEAAPGVGLLTFRSPGIARDWRPGAFVHLRTGDESHVLRRPFSVARVRDDEIVLLYRIVGSGTEWMRARRFGDPVDAMGPLGTCFDLRVGAKRTLLVGGGLGIAPLLGLAEALQREGHEGPVEALLGVRSRGDVFGPTLTEGVSGVEWRLATDDGSDGFHGNAVQLLAQRLDELAAAGEGVDDLAVYAAGPEPMLEACAHLCLDRGADLQVSMEAHMGCGVGACRACGIVTWRDTSRINGRVCREGPVFDAREILWEEVGR